MRLAIEKLKLEKEAREKIEKEEKEKERAEQALREKNAPKPIVNYLSTISGPTPTPGASDTSPLGGINPLSSSAPSTVTSSITPTSMSTSWLTKIGLTSEKSLNIEDAPVPTEIEPNPMSAEQVI